MVARPPIPSRYANPKITHDRHLPPVKYQILNCQGKDILVGRLKVETPTVRTHLLSEPTAIDAQPQDTGHAFILRRFDTQAISLTTMFRAAFPNAPESDEKAEINWVREHYDLSGNNGSTKDVHITRLAGTWVSPAVALELGEDYGLGALINTVVDAKPDPSANYRRSGKAATNGGATASTVAAAAAVAPFAQAPPPYATTAQSATGTRELASEATLVADEASSRLASKSLPTPSPPSALPPSKRRKASSPAPASPRPSRIPALASPAPTPVTDRVIAPLRRSARTSPAPTRSLAATTVVSRTPKAGRAPAAAKKDAPSTVTVTVSSSAPAGSELTVVDEETMAIEDGIIGTGLHEEDMAEQQKLLQEMAQKREAAKAEEEEEDEDELVEDPTGKKPLVRKVTKRRADELLEQPDKGVLVLRLGKAEEDRVIATNRRIKAQSKSLLWGVAAFAMGVGVMFLPNIL